MNDANLTVVLLVIAFAATLVGRFVVRRFGMRLRRIPAYEALPLLTADAVESNHRLHFSLGQSALVGESTVSALVGAELFYRLAARLAVAEQTPTLSLAHPLTLPLAQDTLRRAYEHRQHLEKWRSRLAAWYPEGIAFAAGVASLSADRHDHSLVLLGRYREELALLGEGALRHDQRMIAHSDWVEGQAVAFAQAAHVLLGEELYVGSAYLGGNALERGGVLALETLRWLVIAGIVIELLQTLL